jgi:hypothetical protein
LVARLEDAQGLTRAPEPPLPTPDAALPETRGEEEDHANPGDRLMASAVPPKVISDSNTPVISDDVISTEVAAEHHPDQSAPIHPPPIRSSESESRTGEGGRKVEEGASGVGHTMVEGGLERTEEIREAEAEIIKSPETAVQASLQPAALDSEVAKMIAEEEMKDTIPASPDIVAAPEPGRKGMSESRVQTPDLNDDEDVLDLGEEIPTGTGTKRPRGDDGIQVDAPKRPKRQFRSLPDELSHLVHPPTTCLYISNLRRPLLLPALHEYIFPDPSESTHSPLLPPPKGPFSSTEYPNVWLSGIKSHAYAVFDTIEQSIETAKKIDGKVFPEETGGKLKVDFVDEDEITRLVQREEQAWLGGRQKLELRIIKVDDGSGSEYRFDLSGGTSGNSRQGQGQGRDQQPNPPPPGRRVPVAVPLSGINAIPVGPGGSRFPGQGAGAGQGQGQGFRGGPGGPGGPGQRGPPPHLDRRDRDGGYPRGDTYRPGPGGMPGPNGRAAVVGGERRTKTRPELSWKEGPRAR